MKRTIYRDFPIFEEGGSYNNYTTFINRVLQAHKELKETYPDLEDKDINVSIEQNCDSEIVIEFQFSTLETDAEYNQRISWEEMAEYSTKLRKIKEFKKFLKENPEIKSELLND